MNLAAQRARCGLVNHSHPFMTACKQIVTGGVSAARSGKSGVGCVADQVREEPGERRRQQELNRPVEAQPRWQAAPGRGGGPSYGANAVRFAKELPLAPR
jgi:hypothetical protein